MNVSRKIVPCTAGNMKRLPPQSSTNVGRTQDAAMSCVGAMYEGQGAGRVPSRTHGSVSLTGARVKAWCLLIYAEASLSHGQQVESLVSPHTRGSVSLAGSRVPGRKPGASSYTRKRIFLVGAMCWYIKR